MNKLLLFVLVLLNSLAGRAQVKDSLSAPALYLRTEAIRRLEPDIRKVERTLALSGSVASPSTEFSFLLDESLRIAADLERADLLAFLYLAKGRMENMDKKPERARLFVSRAEGLLPSLRKDSALALGRQVEAFLRTCNKPSGGAAFPSMDDAARQGRPIREMGERMAGRNKKEFRAAYREAVRLAAESGDPELLHATQIVYAHNLVVYGSKTEGINVYKALAVDASVSEKDRVHILCQLVINLFKLNSVGEAVTFYGRLQKLVNGKESVWDDEEYRLATAMHLEYRNQVLQAKLVYLGLVQQVGESSLISLEGMIRLAALYSRGYQRDSAEVYFSVAGKEVQGPMVSPSLQYEYHRAYQDHRYRFQKQGALTDSLLQALQVQDAQYRQELVKVTQELGLKNQVLESSQRARQAEQQQKIEALNHARLRQRFWLAVLVLGLVALTAVLVSYVIFHRRRRAALLHQKEMEMLEQKHRSEVLQTLSQAQESERSRIAGQLHDEIGSLLSVARLNLSSLKTAGGETADAAGIKLDTADKLLGDISVAIREMSHQLMPVALKKYGLKKTIRQLVADINAAGCLAVEEVIVGLDETVDYSEEFKVGVYRIVQEIMQNIVKHSGADKAMVQIVEHEDLVSIVVEDNGKGIRPDGAGKGMGLQLLQSRIAYLEGEMVIENGPEGGTLVSAEIPLKNRVH